MKSNAKAQIELTQELLCVDCDRDIRNDELVFQFRGPMTFGCRACVTEYFEQEYGIYGIDVEQELSFRATPPSLAIKQRIRFS